MRALAINYNDSLTLGSAARSYKNYLRAVVHDSIQPVSTFHLSCMLIAMQILDAIFTFIGVSALGPSIEGNLILRELILIYGAGPTLLVTKASAVLFASLLACTGAFDARIKIVIASAIVFYISAAIVPWIKLLWLHGFIL